MPSLKYVTSPAAQIVLLTIQDAKEPITRHEIYKKLSHRFAETTVAGSLNALKSEGLIHICEWRIQGGHRVAFYKAGQGVNVTYQAIHQRPVKPVFIPRPDPAAAWMRNEIPEEV